eukprot:TRINITY_DN95167_c0_g1_i1.p1 TRINITY_DN95167_c0_g1~~TRINITY_DN95167_c0_g1_i1.p1  ORF type:complete len:331 (+),score=56.87 TRINITY_DN95167_c0_g1_i1:97-1089(+)
MLMTRTSLTVLFSFICSALVAPGSIASTVDDASLAQALNEAEGSQCISDVAGDANNGNCEGAEALELLQTRAKGVASAAMPDEDRKRNAEWMKSLTRNYDKTGDAETERDQKREKVPDPASSSSSASAPLLVQTEAESPWINLTYDSDGEPDDLALPGGWGEAEEAVANESKNLGGHWWHGHYYGHRHRHYYARRRRYHRQYHPQPAVPHTYQVMTLYHQTGSNVGPLILAHGFRPGTQGWCGGGIYFATSPQATETKAIGPDSHKGYMIEARVNVGRVKMMPRQCDRGMNAGRIHAQGYNTIRFNPGDGDEIVVYSPSQVLSVRHIPWR